MNVDIDLERVDREFDVLLAELPPDPLEGDYIPAGGPVGGWFDTLQEFKVAEFAHQELAPNWDIEDKHKEGFTRAAADTLDKLWPGGLGNADSWGPWARLAYFAAIIALANFDPETKTFRPLRVKEPEAPQPAEGESHDSH